MAAVINFYASLQYEGSILHLFIFADNYFVEVVPNPGFQFGQTCGLCGNYNRNKFDDWTGKDGTRMFTSAHQLVNEYKWKD